jgi:hypothetical protein
MTDASPNHALQRTAASRRGCNRRASWSPSLSLVVSRHSGGIGYGDVGPGQIDQSVRQAIQMCWMMLPDERKSIPELKSSVVRSWTAR